MLRPIHQSAFHWVAVDVALLLDVLLFGPHVEIVEALLPHGGGFGVGTSTHCKGRDEWRTLDLIRLFRLFRLILRS